MSSSDGSDESWSDDPLPPDYLSIAAAEAANHFKFDPLASSSSESADGGGGDDEDDDDDDPERWRVGNVNWCTCGHCRPMAKPVESKCCRETPRVEARIPAGAACITAHPTFQHGCLNIHALEIAYYWHMEDSPSLVDDPEIHRVYRHVAYRQFVRWVWHRLGLHRRVVVPSCAVSKIRDTFPSETYAGFQYPQLQ